jgi:hypothetical protein
VAVGSYGYKVFIDRFWMLIVVGVLATLFAMLWGM